MFIIKKNTLEKLYYLYIVSAIIGAFLFVIIKCKFNFNHFDRFIYKNKKNFIEYILFHVITYFILGLIFGFTNYILMIFKTFCVEVALNSIHKCDPYYINIEYTLYSIFISVVAFTLGCLINYYYYYNKNK